MKIHNYIRGLGILMVSAAIVIAIWQLPNAQASVGMTGGSLAPQQLHYRQKIVIDNGRAYALTFGGRIEIYDLSDPLYPKMLGYVSTPELGTSDFDVSGDYLYMFDYDYAFIGTGFEGMIYVFDVGDASQPMQLAKFNGWRFGTPYTIRADRQYLHSWHVIENEPKTIEIYEISDLSTARYVSSYGPGAYILYVEEERSYLLESGGINIYDVSDVTNPQSIGTDALLDITQGATNFTVSDHFLYLTSQIPENDGTHTCEIRIIDIEDLDTPKLLGLTEIESLCGASPVVEGDRLYVPVWRKMNLTDTNYSAAEIMVFDISVRTSIRMWARYEPPPSDWPDLRMDVSASCMYIIGTYDDVLTTICTTLAPQVTVTPTATPTITSTSTATRSPTLISLYLPLLQIE